MGMPECSKSHSREAIQALFDECAYDGCVRAFRDVERERPLDAAELVQLNRCLQLGSGTEGDVDEAEARLHQALKLAPDYVPALLELGWIYHALRDDSASAMEYFILAERLSRETLREALEGRRECKIDLEHG